MRRVLFSTTNDKGFILLHVLFIISLFFIIVTHGISSYHNELYISDRQIDYITVESIFQMARENYKRDFAISDDIIKEISYVFPSGHANITTTNIEDTYIELLFEIYFPNEPVRIFSYTHLLSLE